MSPTASLRKRYFEPITHGPRPILSDQGFDTVTTGSNGSVVNARSAATKQSYGDWLTPTRLLRCARN